MIEVNSYSIYFFNWSIWFLCLFPQNSIIYKQVYFIEIDRLFSHLNQNDWEIYDVILSDHVISSKNNNNYRMPSIKLVVHLTKL